MKKILIVEDDIDLAEGIEIALGKDELQFFLCTNIKEARNIMEKIEFDLLILDVNLPDGSGFDFCKEIRKTNGVSILLLTARDLELDVVRGLESGADDYIVKPFSVMVLRARIRALLRRYSQDEEKEYSKGIFNFKFSIMEFYKEGKLVDLSKTEQKILYLLVFNENVILTRERLLEWVWPDGTEYVDDNALSVGIRRLRDKLEYTPSKPKFIKTIYGKGYVWENNYAE
ncbi:MAG: response regulator transcription factor [Miniphocaeibacter sp.]|uniref:response regulator transcription factor n=1 Tax=Miniphocaeibacter sp. TaxID=3100973 RepID=UPI00184D8174|nr:response regulator transcription factor [Gallicola sp.]